MKAEAGWRPTAEDLAEVEELAALNMEPSAIALRFGVTQQELEISARRQLDRGKLALEKEMRASLKKQAKAGNAQSMLHLVREISGKRNELVSSAELASWLCCSGEIISQMAQRGTIESDGRGVWRLKENVQRVVTHLRATAAARSPAAGDGDEPPANMSPTQALAWEKKVAQKRENDRAIGLLIDAHVYREEFAALLKVIVHATEVLPDVLEAEAGLTPKQVEVVQRVLDDSRRNLAARLSEAP